MIKLILASFRFALLAHFGGGGGGGGNSGGNDELWNAQAEQVKQTSAMSGEMFDYWQKYSPQYLNNASAMTQEAMDGTLTNKMRNKAATDANAAISTSNNDSLRALTSYGAVGDPSSARFLDVANKNAISAAATRAGAMNNAEQWGENQKWARNQDAYGLTSGMPGNAVASANSAQAGLNGMSSMQNSSNNVAAQNAAGYGTMGATLASGLFKADGGIVRAAEYKNGSKVHKVNCLASGGMPNNPVQGWRARMANMPTIGKSDNGSSPIASLVSGAAPKIATELAKPYLEEAGNAIKDGIGKTFGEARNGLERLAGVDQSQPAAEVIDKSTGLGMDAGSEVAADAATDAATTAATDATATTATDAALTAGADAAATAATEAATVAATDAAATAATTAAADGVVAANAWNPIGWIGGLALAASMFSDGGSPQDRIDMTPGGPVEGKGTETSDSIPAWLSDKEYVLNSEAVKLVGKEALDELNEEGLKVRYGNGARKEGRKPNGLFNGGMLGVALGAGAQTFNQLEQQKERTRLEEENMQLRRNADEREAQRQDVAMQQANLALEEQKQRKTDSDAIRKVAMPSGLTSAINSAGGVDSYIAKSNASADPESPLSKEQEAVIRGQANAESPLNPITQFKTAQAQAAILARTNPKEAHAFMDGAMQTFGGHMISAIKERNPKALIDSYNAIPNGHSISDVKFDNGNVVVTDDSGTRTIPERELISSIYAKVNPDKAMSIDSIEARAKEKIEQMAETLDARERQNAIHNQFLRDKAMFGGGNGSGSSGSVGTVKKGDPDFIKIGSDLKAFGDDGAANADTARLAHDFYNSTQGENTQRRAVDAMQGAMAYRARRDTLVAEFQKDNDGKMPTEDQINDQIAPPVIDPMTGTVARRFSINPADPAAPAYIFGTPIAEGAPAPVLSIRNGQNRMLPAVIASIQSGTLDDADRAKWNAKVSESVAGLPDDQKQAVLAQWGADGLIGRVTKYVKPTTPPAKESAATVSAKPEPVAPRSEAEIALYGERPKGLGDAIAWAAKKAGDVAGAAKDRLIKYSVEPNDKALANALYAQLAKRSISDEDIVRLKNLVAKYPDLAERFKIDPVTLAPSQRSLGTVAGR